MAGLLAVAGLLLVSPVRGDWLDDVDYTRLRNELGAAIPTGAGVVVSQVEANQGEDPDFLYLPDPAHAQLAGKTFTDGSGISTGPSDHSTRVGRFFYGTALSAAPGVTDVTGFEANQYVNQVLQFSTGRTPSAQAFQVQNHSWIGRGVDPPAAAVDVLQRLDYVIDTSEMTVVVGLDNDVGTVPDLMAQGYNTISVGRSDGQHSFGTTTLYGTGRIKPEIVVPTNTTSWATAMVSSAAAMLHETGAGTNAVRTEPLKAILLAGATKGEFPNWSRTSTRPLDTRFGAGELNIHNSHRIMTAGEMNGSTSQPAAAAGLTGWDYNNAAAPAAPVYYDLVINPGQVATELSAALAWNVRTIDSDPAPQVFSPSTS